MLSKWINDDTQKMNIFYQIYIKLRIVMTKISWALHDPLKTWCLGHVPGNRQNGFLFKIKLISATIGLLIFNQIALWDNNVFSSLSIYIRVATKSSRQNSMTFPWPYHKTPWPLYRHTCWLDFEKLPRSGATLWELRICLSNSITFPCFFCSNFKIP